MATKSRSTERDTVNIRIPAPDLDLIDTTARSSGKTPTDFILQAVRKAAHEELLDRTVLAVSPKAFSEFLKRLDAPPKPNERLRRTMRSSVPWKRS